jgi:hypothetical protein
MLSIFSKDRAKFIIKSDIFEEFAKNFFKGIKLLKISLNLRFLEENVGICQCRKGNKMRNTARFSGYLKAISTIM